MSLLVTKDLQNLLSSLKKKLKYKLLTNVLGVGPSESAYPQRSLRGNENRSGISIFFSKRLVYISRWIFFVMTKFLARITRLSLSVSHDGDLRYEN